MALIFAFRDETGIWYGQPDAVTDAEPQTAELVMDDSQANARPGNPFLGQTLTVKFAPVEDSPGSSRYRVSNGRHYYTTDTVENLFDVDSG